MIIVLATHNAHKRDELLQVLRKELPTVEVRTLDDIHPPIGDIPETGTTLAENAAIKAREVFTRTGLPTVADDTGLEVMALSGAPGVYSARYAGENASYADNVKKLLDAMSEAEDRASRFVTVLCFIDGSGSEQLFRGEVEGEIIREQRGSQGFGYDPVFAPREDPKGRTFAEMSSEDKNALSHRGRALRRFAEFLREKKTA